LFGCLLTRLRQKPLEILQPSELLTEQADPALWMADSTGLHRTCEGAISCLVALPAGTPSVRLLVDKAAAALAGMSHALNDLALLVRGPARPVRRRPGIVHLHVPDWRQRWSMPGFRHDRRRRAVLDYH
jgi:hypothetical protein